MKLPCPLSVLPAIAAELRKHGAEVIFLKADEGLVVAWGGKAGFQHIDGILHVEVIEDQGHFPKRMLFGGLRQLVEEAVEAL